MLVRQYRSHPNLRMGLCGLKVKDSECGSERPGHRSWFSYLPAALLLLSSLVLIWDKGADQSSNPQDSCKEKERECAEILTQPMAHREQFLKSVVSSLLYFIAIIIVNISVFPFDLFSSQMHPVIQGPLIPPLRSLHCPHLSAPLPPHSFPFT